jgi:hypothetical protein
MDHSVKGKGISQQPAELHLRALYSEGCTPTDRQNISLSKEQARESNELSQRSEGGERRALETCRLRALRTTEPAVREGPRGEEDLEEGEARGSARLRSGAAAAMAVRSALNFRQIYHRSLSLHGSSCQRARKLFLQRGFAARDLLRKVSINRAEFALSNCARRNDKRYCKRSRNQFFLCAALIGLNSSVSTPASLIDKSRLRSTFKIVSSG